MNIQTLKNDETMSFDESLNLSLKSLRFSSDITEYDAKIYGTVTKNGKRITVQGYIDLDLIMFCDRCMKRASNPIHAELFCEFSTDPQVRVEDEDVKPVTKSSIDLSDAILESIAMHLPMKVLCNEDCKGLCKKCGANLNDATCQCDALDIDPRLEQLKNIFSATKDTDY